MNRLRLCVMKSNNNHNITGLKGRLRLCALFLAITVLCSPLSATSDETIFSLDKPKSDIQTTYSEADVIGKKVISVYAFPTKVYYAFIALDVSTMVVLPYPVRWNPENKSADIINPSQDIIKIDHKTGDSYFTIKPSKAGFTGHKSTIHIVCENGFTLLLNITVTDPQNANQLINFLDGQKEIENSRYTKSFFDLESQKYQKTLQAKDNTVGALFFNDIQKFMINETIKAGDNQFTLKNIVSIPGYRYYNLELNFDPEKLKAEKILLEVTPFTNFILSEQKQAKQVFEPDSIIYYKDTPMPRATLIFKTDGLGDLYYSRLKVGENVAFENKVNMRLNLDYDIFEPSF